MVELRKATVEDVPAVQALVARAYGSYVNRLGKPPAPMLDDHHRRVADGVVSVLEVDGRVAGVLVLVPKPDHLQLDNVAVDPRFQGRGLGKRLIGEAEAAAARLRLPEVRLYTNVLMAENLALYLRLGFEETHRAQQDGYERVFLRRRVTPAR